MPSNLIFMGSQAWYRGVGIWYVAHPAGKLIHRHYLRRLKRGRHSACLQRRRRVSPSTARWERKQGWRQ